MAVAKDFQETAGNEETTAVKKGKSNGLATGLGMTTAVAATTLLTSNEAAAQAVPAGFTNVTSQGVSVAVSGNTATITVGAQTMTTAATNVVVTQAGQVFVTNAVAQSISGLAAAAGAAGAAGAAAGISGGAIAAGAVGIGVAAAAGGGGDDAPAATTTTPTPLGPTAPVVATPIPDIVVETGITEVSQTISFTDANDDTLSYTVELEDGSDLSTVGLSFDADTGVISGTYTSTTNTVVNITATDPGGLSATDSFQITINTAPVPSGVDASGVITKGYTIDIDGAALFIDDNPGDTLTYALNAEAEAAGFTIDPNTGQIGGTFNSDTNVTVVGNINTNKHFAKILDLSTIYMNMYWYLNKIEIN